MTRILSSPTSLILSPEPISLILLILGPLGIDFFFPSFVLCIRTCDIFSFPCTSPASGCNQVPSRVVFSSAIVCR